MIELSAINEILALYKKHGWTLRRVLISSALEKYLSTAIGEIFGEIEVVSSPLDAAWFSRPSRPKSETWELRHFSETPFALVEVINEGADDASVEETLRKTESKMIDVASSGLRSVGNRQHRTIFKASCGRN